MQVFNLDKCVKWLVEVHHYTKVVAMVLIKNAKLDEKVGWSRERIESCGYARIDDWYDDTFILFLKSFSKS